MKEACLIIPYYGNWPVYMNIFLESCKHNLWLDVLFFTDIKERPNTTLSNVQFINFSLTEIEKKVKKLTNISGFKIPFNYKLCDLKPLYGSIFEDYISDYIYWAYGDCDLVYGDVYSFVKTKFESKIDFISFHDKWLSGSFTLVRNNPYNNKLFQKLEMLEKHLNSEVFEGIDEVKHQWIFEDRLELSPSCMTYLVQLKTNQKKITSSFENNITEELIKNDLIFYNNGTIDYNHSFKAYFHYVSNKIRPQFCFPNWRNVPQKFYINETGFYKAKWQATILRPFKKYPKLFFYYMLKLPNYIKRKLLLDG
ncbi:DUF6625 family protein [Pedobacter sp. ASV28]|uniref:DUF6625 family protein n=1 Tax=Pedobacter sp. ASV28 TaxID=2795123 RepID=UPI0018EB915F|nr:DUF6625 family protein [Pedobacter sp. ASV28]